MGYGGRSWIRRTWRAIKLMAFLNEFMQSPATILGLSVLNQADRPAAGLLQGQDLVNRFATQRSNLESAALRRDLMNQEMLKMQQEQELQRQRAATAQKRQDVLQDIFQPQPAAGPPQQVGGQLVPPTKPSLFQTQPEQALTRLAAVDPQTAIGFMNALKPAGGTNIDIDLNEPMSMTDLIKIRDGEGNPPPIGASIRDISGARNPDGSPVYSVKSPKEQERTQNVDTALGLVGTMRNLAFPTEGKPLFQEYEGVFGRAAQGAQQGQSTERGKRLRLYNNATQGFLSMLARTFGERGTLTNQDIGRALKLLARAHFWPDQPDTARDAFDQLEGLIREIDGREAPDSPNVTVKAIGDTVFIKQPDGTWETAGEITE
jgi:hypothetical protein